VTVSVPETSALNAPLFRTDVDTVATSEETLAALARGRSAVETPNRDLALKSFTTAISAGDLWPYYQAEALNSRGIIHMGMRRIDEAISDFNQVIAIDPFSYAAYSNRGTAYRIKGELDVALADQNKALGFFPDYGPAYRGRAAIHFVAKKFDLAMADLNEAVRLEPDNAFAYADRGRVYRAQKDFDHAIADYSKAIEIKRYVEIIHEHFNERGYLYLATDQFQKALADFNRILSGSRTGTAENYAGRCVALIGVWNAEGALKDCDKSLSIDATQSEVFHSRGLANFMLGRYSRALVDFNTAFGLDTSNSGAIYGRGVAKAKLGDVASGRSDMDQAQSMNPGIAATMTRFGVSP
jgi:tetratricopeptide (TPR) repeat protein